MYKKAQNEHKFLAFLRLIFLTVQVEINTFSIFLFQKILSDKFYLMLKHIKFGDTDKRNFEAISMTLRSLKGFHGRKLEKLQRKEEKLKKT